MWIVKNNGRYIYSVNDAAATIVELMISYTSNRDEAMQFAGKQVARTFMDKYSITGSIIPY